MNIYLYRFGYFTPKQYVDNARFGWDDECASLLMIRADSEADALKWGEQVAERYVGSLYSAGDWKGDIPSWSNGAFASWIEAPPFDSGLAEVVSVAAHVAVGELPDFRLLDSDVLNRRVSELSKR